MRKWHDDAPTTRLDRFSTTRLPAASVAAHTAFYWTANNTDRPLARGLGIEGGKRWAQARLYQETYA